MRERDLPQQPPIYLLSCYKIYTSIQQNMATQRLLLHESKIISRNHAIL
jgi:hypothetical protein